MPCDKGLKISDFYVTCGSEVLPASLYFGELFAESSEESEVFSLSLYQLEVKFVCIGLLESRQNKENF